MKPVLTEDGSLTFYSPEFDENYHSLMGAREESLKKFIEPSGLLKTHRKVFLLDIGFGLGYNSLTFMEEADQRGIPYEIDSFELFPKTLEAALEVHSSDEKQLILKSLIQKQIYQGQNGSIRIYFGDARENLSQISGKSYHCVFLDPFSPPKNPELWTTKTLQKLAELLSEDGKILTYSAALSVITAFQKAGLFVGYTPPAGRTRGGLEACLNRHGIAFPLSEKDQYLLAVSAHSIPNSETGGGTAEKIKAYRQKLSQWSKENGILLPHKRALKLFS